MDALHNAHVKAWVGHHARQLSRKPIADSYKPQALHEYTDNEGNPTHWRIRLKHPDTGGKWIRPMRREGAGFVLKQPDYPDGVPLYRLHELTARPGEQVHAVEGEQCADALAALGILTTTSGAADSAGKADWSILTGRAVTVWPDFDEAGQRYAQAVKEKLESIGCTVAIIDVAKLGLPHKADSVDWLKLHPEATAADIHALPKTGLPESTQSADNGAADTNTPPNNTPEQDKATIARLAALSRLDYDRERTKAAKELKVRPATLDAMVKDTRKDDEDGERLPFKAVEPWPDPIDPAALLTEVSDTIRRFIVLAKEQSDAAALWVAFTWFIDVVETAPLALINAPERACGKSQLLTLLGRFVCRPLPAANSSASFLFRAVEAWTPTLLIDETDTFIRENDELKGLINAGHTRANAFVGRVVGEDLKPALFSVWGAKALAGIALEKHLPDATMSRAIVFNMRRKLAGENVARLRYAEAGLFDRLASKLARFAEDYAVEVQAARPALPEKLSDREQDNWEPLLAIAGCSGVDWMQRATHAALKLSGAETNSQSASNELLDDIQHVFETMTADKIKTADMIAALVSDEESAWATWNRGRPLTPRQLGKMLSAYDIRSKDIRNGYEVAKGFTREQFADAFERYLATPPDLSATSATNPANPINTGDNVSRMLPQRSAGGNLSATPKPASNKACSAVADKTPILGGCDGASADVEFF